MKQLIYVNRNRDSILVDNKGYQEEEAGINIGEREIYTDNLDWIINDTDEEIVSEEGLFYFDTKRILSKVGFYELEVEPVDKNNFYLDFKVIKISKANLEDWN